MDHDPLDPFKMMYDGDMKMVVYEMPMEPDVVHWEPDPETAHWNPDYALGLWDGLGWWSADVRRDGCVHLCRYHNAPRDQQEKPGDFADYIHLCDLDKTITMLQELQAKAKAYYGEDWA